jgi:hypothetical protein
MRFRMGVAVIGLSAIIGSTTGVAQAAARDQAAPPPALTLSASSVSASRMIGVSAEQLRPNATYELINNKSRADASSAVGGSGMSRVLARVKTDNAGRFSTQFVVPLNWRHDHLIELRKVKGADLVAHAHWLTVTPPRPSLALSTNKVHRGSGVEVVVSGMRAHAKYRVFSNKTRANAEDPMIGGSSDDGVLHSVRTDAKGRGRVTIMIPDVWLPSDHLIEVKWKAKRPTANSWLTVLR